MEQIDIEKIKRKTGISVIFLSLRNFGIQLISIIGFFILTVLLGTAEVGLFAIVAESIAILGYFSDVGLAAALIQQKDDVSKEDLRTTFTIQQILVAIALIVVIIIYPNIAHSKGFGSNELWIVASLCFAFITASLKTIPSVLLERKLNFKLISTIDVVENIIFYFVAVIFAYLGFGVLSYAIATFFRSIIGLVIMYSSISWDIGFTISIPTAKKLFKYGIPYQLNSFIAVAKDRLSTLFVAALIGTQYFGILSWAQKVTRFPLSFMDAIMKITFPTFSRLQDHPELLKKSLEKSLYFIALVIFPLLAGISLVVGDIINSIPKYSKWELAIVPVYFYTLNAGIAAITTPITNAFNSIGKITLTTKLMLMWTILTWIFYPLFSWKFGYIGTVWATLLVGLSSFIVWKICDDLFKISTFKIIFKPLISTLFMVFFVYLVNLLGLSSLINISLKILIGVTVYTICQFTFAKEELFWFINQIKCLKQTK